MTSLLAVLALGLAACGDAVSSPRPAEAPNDGVQFSGRVGGAQLSVSFGDPDFLIEDCDPQDGLDRDWCLVARSIDGARVEFVFENPRAFVAGDVLDVDFDRCTTECDDVEGAAVVDLVLADGRRRAVDGSIDVIEVGPRYAMVFTLRFDDGGVLSGEFNVRPLGALVAPEDRFDSEG